MKSSTKGLYDDPEVSKASILDDEPPPAPVAQTKTFTNNLKTTRTMAAQIFKKLDTAVSPFQYNGKICIADPVTDYAIATPGTFTNWKFIGSVVGLAWAGSDASTEPWVDDEGNTLTTKITPGTSGWTLDVGSTSIAQLTKWLNATKIATMASDYYATESTFYKMKSTVTQIVPMLVMNDEENKTFLFPKTKITSSFNMVDSRFTVKLTLNVEDVDTENLSSAMYVDGKANTTEVTLP